MTTLQQIVRRVQTVQAAEQEGDAGTRWAAVAVVLREAPGGVELLLIKRAERPGDPWSGHMAFPGGNSSPGDPSLLHTAIREVEEELGLDLGRLAHPAGQLDDLTAVSRARALPLIVRPYLFSLHTDAPARPNGEVAEHMWVPLAWFSDPAAQTVYPYRLGESLLELPAWRWGPHVIWGMTQRMLQNLLDVLGAGG